MSGAAPAGPWGAARGEGKPNPPPQAKGNRTPPGPPRGRRPKRLPEVLSVEECEAMVKATGASRYPLRDKALVLVLWGAGLRVSEVVGARLDALRYEPLHEVGVLRVVGKGDLEREVVLPNRAWRALVEYLHDRIPGWHFGHRDLELDREPLFESERQTPLGRKSIWGSLKRIAGVAGIPPARVSPHVFRHSCATHLHQSGEDIRYVQGYLGHADIGSTEIYTHVGNDALLEMGRRHPMGGD